MTKKKVTTKKSKKMNKIKLVVNFYKNININKIGLSLVFDGVGPSQLINITDAIFNDYNEANNYIGNADIVVLLSDGLKKLIKKSNLK